MSPDSDALVDRRRLKRRLALWRLVAFVALAALIVVAAWPLPGLPGASRIVTVGIDGLILADRERERAIRGLAEDASAAALILRIDSPGGATFASEALYRAVRKVGETRPVVAVMDGVAASGGYMAALAADRIFARESTVTGSIGVVLQAPDLSGLMEKIGVANELVRSGPLKAEPNPFAPLSPEAREAARRTVQELHRMFVGLVAERRALAASEAARIADGRVFTGAAARDAGLVDSLGGVDDAIAWLEAEAGVAEGLPLAELSIPRRGRPLWRELLGAAFSFAERSLSGDTMLTGMSTGGRGLDGPLSLWQPFAAQ